MRLPHVKLPAGGYGVHLWVRAESLRPVVSDMDDPATAQRASDAVRVVSRLPYLVFPPSDAVRVVHPSPCLPILVVTVWRVVFTPLVFSPSSHVTVIFRLRHLASLF
jgi:hypothetical protein